MTVSFNFDERSFRQAVEKVAKDAVGDVVRRNQAMFDRMHQRYRGQPKATVLAALRTEMLIVVPSVLITIALSAIGSAIVALVLR